MRAMSVACAALSALAFSVLPSLAQDQQGTPPSPISPVTTVIGKIMNAPDGWTKNLDGSYRHAESNILCPFRFKSFELQSVTPGAQDHPNIIGVCRYEDGNDRTGSIRIRKYLPGWGSDETLAKNDKILMDGGPDAPPMLMRASTDRRTGAQRLTVTTARHGYLIDCSVAQMGSSRPKGDFPLYCTTIPPQ